jgi:hypothetical protein
MYAVRGVGAPFTVAISPDSPASGITVTGATPNYTYSAIAGTVETPGTISATGATPDYSYNAIGGTVTLFGTITVTGETPNYTYNSIRGVVTDGVKVYTNNFSGIEPDLLAYNGVVKVSGFSGIISQAQFSSGYAK